MSFGELKIDGWHYGRHCQFVDLGQLNNNIGILDSFLCASCGMRYRDLLLLVMAMVTIISYSRLPLLRLTMPHVLSLIFALMMLMRIR
jgi:hypothetical protein